MANSLRQRPDESRAALLVLGMHRSGTSAMTRVLNILGAELGRNLLPSKDDNAAGFWENQSVVQANEYLLEALGLTWHSPVSLPPRWRQQATIRRFGDMIRRVLDEQFFDAPLIALKDPRLSRLASVWAEALAAEGIRPKIIVMVRHPAEVMRSLKKRDGFSSPKSQLLWLLYTVESMSAAAGLPHVYVHYDRLLANWRREVRRIEESLEISWPKCIDQVSSQVDEFINPGLRHHSVALDTFGNSRQPGSPIVPGKIAHVYRACVAMAEGAPSAQTAIRDVLREVKPWIDVFGGPAREILVQAGQLSAQLRRQFEDYEAAMSDRSAEILSLRTSVGLLEQERDAARANIDDLANQVAVARKAHEARVEEIHVARTTIDGLVAEIGNARENINNLEAQVANARAAHDHHQRLERELRDTLELKDREIAEARDRIDSLVAEIDAARGNNDDLQAQVNAARAIHDYHHKAREQLCDILRQKDLEIETAGNNIDSLVAELDRARMAHRDLYEQVARAHAAHDAREQIESDVRGQAAELEKALSQERVHGASLVIELNAARDTINALVAEVENARAAYAQRMEEIDTARGTIEGLVSELRTARHAHEVRDEREASLRELLSRRELEIAEIGNSLADALGQGDRQNAILKQIQSARWTRLGRVLRLLRGE